MGVNPNNSEMKLESTITDRDMTKKELSQLYYLNKEIEQMQIRIVELEALATDSTWIITGMPHTTGINDRISKYAVELADLKDALEINR